MSSPEQDLIITANVGDERQRQGTVRVHNLNPSERMGQALKKLGIFWGLSIVSILVPVLHFFLVPLFFFMGIFFSYRAYRTHGFVLAGEVLCPHCDTKVEIKPGPVNWPLSEICQSCARVVRIETK